MVDDYLIIGTDAQSQMAFRVLFLNTALEEIKAIQKPGAVLEEKLLHFLTGSLLIGSRHDEQENSLYKLVFGEENIFINVETNPKLEFRAALFPQELKNTTEIHDELILKVVQIKKNQDLYESVVKNKGNVEALFQHYLEKSFQTQCKFKIGLKENISLGVWFDKLPSTTPEQWQEITKHFGEKCFQEALDKSFDADMLMNTLLPDGFKILMISKPKRICSCSVEKIKKALLTLPTEDLVELFMENKGVTSICDYCHTVHEVTDAELQEIMNIRKS